MPTRTSLPPEARRSLAVYNLFFPFVFLLLLPGFLLRMVRRGGYQQKFGQRLGWYSATDRARLQSRRWIWVHSISVGETFIALKLARALYERDPSLGILLSCTTSTGFAEASKAASDWLEPAYNPVDLRSIVRRTLDVIRPTQVLLIEGEAWPNLLAECNARRIPVSLVNARLSPRSERRFRRARTWTGPIFRLLDRITVPEPTDVERWESLGVDRAKIVATGSVKFDQTLAPTSRVPPCREILHQLGVPPDAPIVVGGSTWAPEELALVQAVETLRAEFPSLFLILVPRHVERSDDLVRTLTARGWSVARRTRLPEASPASETPRPPHLLLIDTTGELRDWYTVATVVFIGKSLPGVAEIGGQNPAEPAMLGKPVVHGPHMENFASLTAHFLAQQATAGISSASELATTLGHLLRTPTHRESMGDRAQAILAPHVGATERTANLFLPASPAEKPLAQTVASRTMPTRNC